jgi:hypothetical protein
MNRQTSNETFDFTVTRGCRNFFGFLQKLFAVNSVSFFDVFAYSNAYQEKLPIIYANIRV